VDPAGPEPTGRIEVRGLTKHFGSFTAVDHLDFDVSPGRITGFLGPNGAGKTTTLRMLLGLVRPTSGTATIDGRRYADIRNPLAVVGSALEATNFHPGRTGRNHLRVQAAASGVSDRRVDELLELVGIPAAARKRAGGYSMGMRQRLGLAAALLGDPQVLILDEPANGLDPAGIREIRELVRDLRAEGRTVFLSSHLLGEIEQVCDRVAILAAGRTVVEGPIGEVLAASRPQSMWVRVSDLDAGARSLEASGLHTRIDDGYLCVDIEPERGETVARVLVADGLFPSELRPVESTLEDAFFALTGEARA
jgi:ABC-2 type transport system ATP-binding protein